MVRVVVIEGGAMAEAGLLNRYSGERYQGARDEPLSAFLMPVNIGCDRAGHDAPPGKT